MGRPCKQQFRFLKYFNENHELVSIDLGEENNSNSHKQKRPKCQKPQQAIEAQTTNTNTNVVCPLANIIGESTNFETSEQLVYKEQFFFPSFEEPFFDEDDDIFFPFDNI